MYGVVYLILNKINGRKYVGQTVQPLKVRFNEHAKKKDNTLIANAIRKYGKENFYCGVIKTCSSKEELDYWEKFFIAALKSKKPYGYNLTDGGEGFIGYRHTPEVLAKIRETKKRSSRVAEHCAKIAAARRGKPLSPEHIAKVSAALKGKPKTAEHCAKIAAALKGQPLTPERRAKISATERGYSPFKNLLREIDERQLTYTALGEILGVSSQPVSRKMQGVRKFTEGDKVKLEKFFGKPIEYLLERDAAKEF